MFIINKENMVGKLLRLAASVCIMLGAFCLFFNLTPNGFNPMGANEAWYFAIPLFGIAALLYAADWIWEKLQMKL